MSEVKYISPRISYRENQGETTLVISSQIAKPKFVMLTVWLCLFGLSGLLIVSQIFVPGYPGMTRIGFIAFTSFWAYFMYRLGYVWWFRKSGMEFIRLQDGKLSIKRAIHTYGKSHEFLIGNIKHFGQRVQAQKSFSTELENSFWVLGGERLQFEYLGRDIRFGIQLTDEEVQKLKPLFTKWLKSNKE